MRTAVVIQSPVTSVGAGAVSNGWAAACDRQPRLWGPLLVAR